jgi:hypothetical protein
MCWVRIVSPFGLSKPARMQLRVYETGVAATLRSIFHSAGLLYPYKPDIRILEPLYPKD